MDEGNKGLKRPEKSCADTSDYWSDMTKKGLAKQHKVAGFVPTQSRFTPSNNLLKGSRSTTMYRKLDSALYKCGNLASIYGLARGKGSKAVISPDMLTRSSTLLLD